MRLCHDSPASLPATKSAMFDVTPDDIHQLNDIDLRELLGRLCEAELESQGHSAVAVTWGGNQAAPDGGLDVRVAMPPGEPIEGFIPRPSTGFQVKALDMRRAAILREMRPAGAIRPVIQELANQRGAYVIVSSRGSTSDSALRRRRDALREALSDVDNADQLHIDFYDRTRLATSVRRHPGLVVWVRERVGRALVGWRPYGSWSSAAEHVDAEYLLDDKLRLYLGKHRGEPAQPVASAIDELRDELIRPGTVVRLVGLSGVGKTRFVQALFDGRIGSRPLPRSLAIYTNISDDPNPQPIGLGSDLIANRRRAVLIVDNCPPDLHRSLSNLCGGQTSTVSILTVEYDVREDQPEDTHVVSLDVSSPELIEELVQRRYPHISPVDARTVAEVSGGNARIAVALAQTVERSETIAHLSDCELFQRLFQQRQDPSNALLLAAQVCSLVYSFQGELLEGEQAELPRLASLAGQTAAEIYRHVAELLRRDLVQQRGAWRAVLPHAIANRLAAGALEDIPTDLIEKALVSRGTEHLARSFTRRLSFLHDHPKAVAIVERWLADDGRLGDVSSLTELGQSMFENVAPVLPEAALAALERAGIRQPDAAAMVWWQHLALLRSLAYEGSMFERSTKMLARIATRNTDELKANEALDTFVSLFALHLSGTYATIEQRLSVIEELLRSNGGKARALALAALEKVLEATHFSCAYRFEFGARPRDFGYQPSSYADVVRWYGAALALIERLALTEGMLRDELRDLLVRSFPGLWASARMYSELENLVYRFSDGHFWREGWAACRQTMQFYRDQLEPEGASRLVVLEAALKPATLQERVRAVVLGGWSPGLGLEEMDVDGDGGEAAEGLESITRSLGAAAVSDDAVLTELLPDLLRGGVRAWAFGRGLAGASQDRNATWRRLVEGLEQIPREHRNVQIFRGFLSELWEQDRALVQYLLDSALDQPALVDFLPVLHSAVELDTRGAQRLGRALSAGQVSVTMCQSLAYGRVTEHLGGRVLKDLLLLIAEQPNGFEVALEILAMRLHSDRRAERSHDANVLEAGRELLRRAEFRRDNPSADHQLVTVAGSCLAASDAGPVAAAVAVRLRQAVVSGETYAFNNSELLKSLLELQPAAVLDAIFAGDHDDRVGVGMFEHLYGHRANPADGISCEALIAWCEADGDHRYPLAASIITFACRREQNGPQIWSEQARALLANAPDPKRVLAVMIDRFRPMSWSGSRAALMEANGQLLDTVQLHIPSGLISFVIEAKARLAEAIAREREEETKRDRERDERFEQ